MNFGVVKLNTPIDKAAEMAGMKLPDFIARLDLPEGHRNKSPNLVRTGPYEVDTAALNRFVLLSEQRQGNANILNDHDLTLTLDKASKMRQGIRNAALIAISNYTGLRAVEIRRLVLADVTDYSGKLFPRMILKKARTKNKESRIVYFQHEVLRRYLEPHIKHRLENEGAGMADPVFIAPATGNAYKANDMAQIFKRIYTHCGHPECSSHSGRARFATKLANNHDVKTAQRLLGHSSANTTAMYIRKTDEELAAATLSL